MEFWAEWKAHVHTYGVNRVNVFAIHLFVV